MTAQGRPGGQQGAGPWPGLATPANKPSSQGCPRLSQERLQCYLSPQAFSLFAEPTNFANIRQSLAEADSMKRQCSEIERFVGGSVYTNSEC